MSSNFITIDSPNTMNCSENFVKQINMKISSILFSKHKYG